ncbi:MAG: AEC family transporter [Nanoarchaeota archaeon]|nr:AEC family transporter [Nanoarchaeota archaeon]
MQAIVSVLNTVIPVFLIILLGFLIGRKKQINIQPIIDLIVYIAGPSLIFTSMSRSEISISDFSAIFFAATLIIIILGSLFFFILKITKSKKVGLYLPAVIGNTGYLGYPVALFAFGNLGLSHAIVYDMANSLFIFSLGIYIVHHKNEFKEILKVPLIYAVVFGVLFNIFQIHVPDAVFKPMEMIGAITIPAALLILGYKLTEIRLSKIKIALLVSLFKVVGGFIVGLTIISIINIEGTLRNIILIQSAMPSAVMSMILTHKYGRDSDLAASVVLISTVMSIITIPLILLFVL